VPSYAYLDTSALVKLGVVEAETTALETDILNRDALFSSVIAAVELSRALRRVGQLPGLAQAGAVLAAIFLSEFTPAIREQAGRLDPPSLRTLDAIHLATAVSLVLPDLDFLTYDDRQAAAARALGLAVRQPGR
jgi:uncharacterized protein